MALPPNMVPATWGGAGLLIERVYPTCLIGNICSQCTRNIVISHKGLIKQKLDLLITDERCVGLLSKLRHSYPPL